MTRTIDFKYRVVRNGAAFCELRAVEGGNPRILMDDGSNIKTKFSGRFLPPAEEVNWLTDEIQPSMIIDGAEHRLGVFLPANVTEETDTGPRVAIDAYDRGWTVKDQRTEYMIFFPAGMNYLSAVGSLLAECGLTLISTVPTEEVLAEDRADWDIGTPYLDIVNQLLAEINYEDLWFDADGMAMLEPKATPTANNIEHTLDENSVESLMLRLPQRAERLYLRLQQRGQGRRHGRRGGKYEPAVSPLHPAARPEDLGAHQRGQHRQPGRAAAVRRQVGHGQPDEGRDHRCDHLPAAGLRRRGHRGAALRGHLVHLQGETVEHGPDGRRPDGDHTGEGGA